MPEIYVNDPSELGLVGPFVSRYMAEQYMYDTKHVWKGFTLVEESELDGTEEIIGPKVKYLTLRVQVNRPTAGRHPLREILDEGIGRWNDEVGGGPQFYIIDDRYFPTGD